MYMESKLMDIAQLRNSAELFFFFVKSSAQDILTPFKYFL